jgi:hypothetical protein
MKWCKWCKIVSPFLSNNTYGLPVLTMVTKYPKQHTICVKDGLEMWFSPNDEIRKCLIDMRHGSIKNAFETWITLNDVNGVSLFHLLYNNTYGLSALTTDTKFPNQVLYVCLVDLYTICDKQGLETWISPNSDIRICSLDMIHI